MDLSLINSLFDYSLSPTNYDSIGSNFINFFARFAIGLAILWFGAKIISRLAKMFNKLFMNSSLDNTVSSFIYSSISIGLRIFLVLFVLSIWGVKTATFIAVFGAFSLAIGLALQGSMSNVASGVLILLLKPFKVDDYITVQSLSGTVKKIELFFTSIITLDNRTVVIPNSILTTQIVTNFSRYPERRVEIPFQVSLVSNIDKAHEVLNKVLEDSPHVVMKNEKESFVRLTAHSNGVATFTMYAWVKRGELLISKEQLAQNGYRALKDAKIELLKPRSDTSD